MDLVKWLKEKDRLGGYNNLRKFVAFVITFCALLSWFKTISIIGTELTRYALTTMTLLFIASLVWLSRVE